ncbi:MAG: hypothetical protein H7061_00390, partial [Bdellovibrionaceae bacterium]|nr:hypothetical protein [Bdellovibrio sp.]
IISDFRGVILDKYITCDKSFVANDRSRALVNADSGLELGKFVDTETRIYTSVRLPDDADGSVPAAPAPKAD